ncbi:MAG: 4-alpha-glucanotransferase [Clostridia bacterium]|nr:4-alpha-glucanotransferase [Clostridia bacterium]
MRASGILMPVFSLPSPYGIGTLGEKAYNFVDFLKKSGQSYWQILPLNPTNYGDSPYQSFSSAAGNPYFIDLDMLSREGLLLKEEYEEVDFGSDPFSIDYAKLYENRYPVLRKAFARFKKNDAFKDFCKAEGYWLNEYALFMALKDSFGGKAWYEWDDALKLREEASLKAVEENLSEEIDFHKFVQFKFFSQWQALKKYANENGIKIIGDMPIYVALDSADVWSNTKQFDLDENLTPNCVAGTPPDAFSEDGQLWGSPLYDWDYMEKEAKPYSWWCNRLKSAFSIYDVVRIDHFRGFEAYYAIKYGAKTAKDGVWKKGPDMKLFEALKKEFGEKLPIIAEDLGFLTPEVKKLLKDSGFPGMKVLQFAFDSREDSDYLPHNYPKNCIVYTGTHDNDTVIGWTKSAKADDVKMAEEYLNTKADAGFNWAFIRAAMMSVADTAIFMMPDFIGLGSEGRINTPSTLGDNWKWRIEEGCTNDWLAKIIYDMTCLYGRAPKKTKKEVGN